MRTSYSILSLWSKGEQEEAVRTYLKLPREETQAMIDGKKFHEEWSFETEENGRLPKVFGDKELVNPLVEKKLEAHITDWLELVGIADCIDNGMIYEYKTGVTDSQTYARTFQGGVYGILATYNDITISQIAFMHYNQYTKRSDTSYVWLTDKRISEAMEWIITYASEMHDYLESNNLL